MILIHFEVLLILSAGGVLHQPFFLSTSLLSHSSRQRYYVAVRFIAHLGSAAVYLDQPHCRIYFTLQNSYWKILLAISWVQRRS